jgi:hypothetical protein
VHVARCICESWPDLTELLTGRWYFGNLVSFTSRSTAGFDSKWFSQVSASCRKLLVPGNYFFPKGIKFLFFKGLYGSGGTSPVGSPIVA